MALFRRFFYRKPPDRLLEISERTYVFDCCFSTDKLDEDDLVTYLGGIMAQLQDYYPDSSFMVFNFGDFKFGEGTKKSQIHYILSQYDMKVMNYPWQYEGCSVLPLEMILHFLRSCESWLSLGEQQNVILIHCERGGWPVLAFILAGLLLYRRQYTGEQKALEMVYKQAPRELLHLLSPLNPQPSQLRYLRYISRRNTGSNGPPSDNYLALDCVILRFLPQFDDGKGCRPLIRLFGQDPSDTSTKSPKLLFSTLRTKKNSRLYRPEECALVKIDIHVHVQGDVVLECLHVNDDLREEMMFRVMFHTAFIQSDVLMLTRDEMDVLWDAKDVLPRDFRAEVLFSDVVSDPSMTTTNVASEDATAESAWPEEFFEREDIFAIGVDSPNGDHTLDGCSNLHSPSKSASISTSGHCLTGLDSEVHFSKAVADPSIPSIITTEADSEDGGGTKIASLEDKILSNSIDKKLDNVAHVSNQRISVPSFQDIGEMMVSLTDEEEVIINRLMRGSSQRDIVSVVGMPGIGKTTLAKKVYSDPKIAHYFHRCAWCSVSQVYGKRELLLDIIKDIQGLTDEFHQITDADLELKLFQKLKKIRYLIVMDEVWNIQALNDLDKSFPDDGVGSRILITSRFHNVALEARPGKEPHMIRPLSDDESWNLLEKKSFPKGDGCPEELEEIGKEIARQCKGLPLAVVAVAGILRRTQNTHNKWKNIAESLSSKINADPETQCKFILELSYMHLPSHLKACFLYLGAFSENKDVPVSKLIRLWIAEGFIESKEAKSLEAIAEDYLMDLINGSLVMISKRRSNGKVKACCIHGLLRDLCLSKAQEDNFLQLISRNDEPYASYDLYDYGSDFYDFYPSDPVTYECQRICIYLKRKHFIHSRPSGPSTSSLIFSALSDSFPRRPYNVTFICHHFKWLRVLDLECINMGSFFPSEIELLSQLRYLAFSGDIDSIPGSISNLTQLKTLIVKGLVGKIILPDSVWHMTSLRHLHINSYAVFSLPDNQIESSILLDNLCSLSVPSLCYGKDAEKILRRMPQLHKLICIFLESWDSSMNCNLFPAMDFLTHLESLDVFYFGRDLNPGEFTFPMNLKKLTLSHFRLPWQRTSAIGRLPNLEVLKLCYGAFVGLMWEMTEDEFTKLKFLKFDTLNIAQWDASYEHLPVLQQLVIHNCKNLEEVPFDFYGIPTLQMIEVQGCKHSVEVSVRKIEEETEGIKIIIS